MNTTLNGKRWNMYNVILNWVEIDLIRIYEDKTRQNLEAESELLMKTASRMISFKRLANFSALGLVIMTIFTVFKYRQPDPIFYYCLIEGLLVFCVITGVILQRRAIKKLCGIWKTFSEFWGILNDIDPFHAIERDPWSSNSTRRLTRSIIVDNLKHMNQRADSYASFYSKLLTTDATPQELTVAHERELQLVNTFDTASSHLWLFRIEQHEI